MRVATSSARLVLPLAAALAAVMAGAPAARAGTAITVTPEPGIPDNGIPPTFEAYPLRDRLFGPGGAIFPGYVQPPDRDGRERFAFMTGGGEGSVVFAAATVDRLCQWNQVPEITVLQGPARGTLSVDIGSFTAGRSDAGTSFCLGRQVRGARLHYAGRPPAGGTSVKLRVFYPIPGRSYDHVVAIPAR
ncbi:MAG TPA: hypothetical protein VLA00_05765 [Xanthobacteraceae bacterium]|nr:hypothetical protein [Xanthobacteraceae bacterium]